MEPQTEKLLVLDTNIILLDHLNILTLGEHNIIVIPETVVEELDSKKTNMAELGYQARGFGRLIAQATIEDQQTIGTLNMTTLQLDGTAVLIVSCSNYPLSADNNDRKIIHIASEIHKLNPNTTFMSNDINCRIQAMARGLTAIDLKEVEQTTYKFTKQITVPTEMYATLHNKPVAELDPDYKLENFNYVVTDITSGATKLAQVRYGVIEVLGRATETELRKQDVNPRNGEQLLFSKAIQSDTDVVLCESKAGTGKSLMAISNAMKLVKGNNPYNKIIYVRASIDDVEKVEEVGFLSGNDEKFAIYFHPLLDSLDYIVRSRLMKAKTKVTGNELESLVSAKIEEAMDHYSISTLTGLGMRGRTFTNSIIIIDEVQGQSKASLQKMLTRVGKDCKVIVIGSQRQIDNAYVTKFNNGFSVLLNQATKPQPLIKLHAITLNKVVRSPMAEWSEDVFDSTI